MTIEERLTALEQQLAQNTASQAADIGSLQNQITIMSVTLEGVIADVSYRATKDEVFALASRIETIDSSE